MHTLIFLLAYSCELNNNKLIRNIGNPLLIGIRKLGAVLNPLLKKRQFGRVAVSIFSFIPSGAIFAFSVKKKIYIMIQFRLRRSFL